MNKRILTFALITFSSVMFISCVPKKKTVTAPVVDAPKIQTPKVEEAGTLVPFTRELFFKLRENGLDIKKLKFYVDNTITLNKTANAANLEINEMSGILINKKGVSDNLIKITPQVVGMVESVEPDGLRLNFGRPNSSLKFINNTLSPKFFAFAGDKVDKATGSVEVMYNSSTYKATSESGGSPTDIKLMIKQLDIETGLNKGVVEPGAGKTLLGY